MAWKEVTYLVEGDAPLIVHNGQTADPLNPYAKAMKKLSGKRQKTDADYEEMARLEFAAGLYIDEAGPYVPAANIDSMVIAAAKKSKEGPVAKSGFYTKGAASLIYEGPRTVKGLWSDGQFRHVAGVRVGQAKVMRTRPIFRRWGMQVTVVYEDTLVNVEQVDRWLAVAGQQVGLGDWRPQHGRFTAKRI